MNMKKAFEVKKLIALVFSLALAVALAACGGTASPANGNGFDPFVGNHGGINFFIQEGVDREEFLQQIQVVIQNVNFPVVAPFVSRYVRTLSGGRVITIDADGRAVVYSDSTTVGDIVTDINVAATEAYEYQNAQSAQNAH